MIIVSTPVISKHVYADLFPSSSDLCLIGAVEIELCGVDGSLNISNQDL